MGKYLEFEEAVNKFLCLDFPERGLKPYPDTSKKASAEERAWNDNYRKEYFTKLFEHYGLDYSVAGAKQDLNELFGRDSGFANWCNWLTPGKVSNMNKTILLYESSLAFKAECEKYDRAAVAPAIENENMRDAVTTEQIAEVEEDESPTVGYLTRAVNEQHNEIEAQKVEISMLENARKDLIATNRELSAQIDNISKAKSKKQPTLFDADEEAEVITALAPVGMPIVFSDNFFPKLRKEQDVLNFNVLRAVMHEFKDAGPFEIATAVDHRFHIHLKSNF